MKIGFIDYYLDEWHANNYPSMLTAASGGQIEVAYAYGQIPSPFSQMTSQEWCRVHKIAFCETIEEVVEKSDALIVLSPDNCEQHEALSRIPLTSRKRTYIDKTFAPDKRSAEAIFEWAEKYGTPCYSASALRFAEEYRTLEGKRIEAMSTWGPNGTETYGIHQLEPILMLMQGTVKRVMALPWGEGVSLLMEWKDGRSASMLCAGGNIPFTAAISQKEGCETITVESDYFGAFIRHLAKFLSDGAIPVRHEETVAIMAVREAAITAEKTPGSWVTV